MSEKEKKVAKKYPANLSAEDYNKFVEKFGADKLAPFDLPLDEDNEEFLEVLLKVPNRVELGEWMKWEDRNPMKANEILINSCLLTNKDEVKKDDALFLTCVNAIAELIPTRKAIRKNY